MAEQDADDLDFYGDDIDEDDEFENFDCAMDRDGNCGNAGSKECDWECPYNRIGLRAASLRSMPPGYKSKLTDAIRKRRASRREATRMTLSHERIEGIRETVTTLRAFRDDAQQKLFHGQPYSPTGRDQRAVDEAIRHLDGIVADALDALARQEMTRLTAELDDLLDAARAKAKREGVSLRALVLGWLKEWVQK